LGKPPRGRGGQSERALIRGAQAGRREDLEELFRRYWPASYRAAYFVVYDRTGAEDIAQEAFLSALRALHRFDRRRPFGPWLHRIVVNRAIDWARARALRRELDVEPPDAELRDEPEVRDELASALATLSPERRAVVVLRYVLDYTPGEIAELLDLPRGTVNSRLRRALDELAGEVARD
jgi:RNA polymerase sigma-70 factor, ECF subfamily